jgi:hypothetical protein
LMKRRREGAKSLPLCVKAGARVRFRRIANQFSRILVGAA